jgi:hypothetical protein
MEATRSTPATPGNRVRLSGRLDSLSPRKCSGGYSLIGSFRLDNPYRGLSRLLLQLPMGSSLLAGDAAELEGIVLGEGPGTPLFDCSAAG